MKHYPTIAVIMIILGAGIGIVSYQNCALAAGTACSYPKTTAPAEAGSLPANPKNFVIILTDDQRADTLQYMPFVKSDLMNHGVTFQNAYATTPLCCPFRASFLGGGYTAQHTNVVTNNPPNGGASVFTDRDTLAANLQDIGYNTGLVGKYLNGYGSQLGTYVPPGWTSFFGFTGGNFDTVSKYTSGSSTPDAPGTGVSASSPSPSYITDYQGDKAIEFLNQQDSQTPFFLYIATEAPHSPATPDTEDASTYAHFNFTDPAVQETNFSDKPTWVQNANGITKGNDDPAYINLVNFIRGQMGCLPSLDRMVHAVVQKLSDKGLLDNTVIIFASDNGYMWGEHNGISGKAVPYEPSAKVPLVVRFPGVAARNETAIVSANLDVPTMIYNMAGISKQTDGMNLQTMIQNPSATWRSYLISQSWTQSFSESASSWIMYRDATWKYVKYDDGQKELYNEVSDPYELSSQHNNATNNALMATLDPILATNRGLVIFIANATIPRPSLSVPYSYTFSPIGGTPPYTCSLDSGALVTGLSVNSNCTLTGTMTSTTNIGAQFTVKIEDSSVNVQNDNHQRIYMAVRFAAS